MPIYVKVCAHRGCREVQETVCADYEEITAAREAGAWTCPEHTAPAKQKMPTGHGVVVQLEDGRLGNVYRHLSNVPNHPGKLLVYIEDPFNPGSIASKVLRHDTDVTYVGFFG